MWEQNTGYRDTSRCPKSRRNQILDRLTAAKLDMLKAYETMVNKGTWVGKVPAFFGSVDEISHKALLQYMSVT